MLHENLINGQLSELLRQYGLDAVPEQRRARKRPDIHIKFSNAAVTIEAEINRDASARTRAIREARDRLEQGIASVSVALLYDTATAQRQFGELGEALRTANFTWQVLPGVASWQSGNIDQLVSVVRQAPKSAELNVNYVARQLTEALDATIEMLPPTIHSALAQRLNLPRDDKSKPRMRATYEVAAKRAMLTLATAIMFQSRLDQTFRDRKPDDWTGEWPPARAVTAAFSPTLISDFTASWNLILELDYKPIFTAALSVLAEMDPNPMTVSALQKTAQVAVKIMEHSGIVRHDVLGRIFHRVLETARYDGSFYTTTAAATLLANLALTESTCDWSDDDAVSELRVVDPACGTGTLLMAAAERIRDLRSSAEPEATRDTDIEKVIALTVVEDMLYGYDTNLTAAHLAATTLGMLSPSTEFRSMNIHQARLDVVRGNAYLGSLEFLRGQARLASWPTPSQHIEPDQQQSGDDDVSPPPMDLVIMNPPFTRDSLRYDQFNKRQETALKNSEKELLATLSEHDRRAARLSGMANAFIVLGKHLIKPESGMLACVLPATMATNPAAFHTRTLLAKKFHVRYIVVPHDANRSYFSENTGIVEMLLVADAKTDQNRNLPTQIIKLRSNPNTPAEAIPVAYDIHRSQLGDRGVVATVDAAKMRSGDWGAVRFLSQNLNDEFDALRFGRLFSVASASDLFKIGPAGQRIRDAFTRVQIAPSPRREAIWDHKGELQRSMKSKHDTFIIAKNGKESLADKYWGQRSNLLLPNRLALTNARVTSIYCDYRLVGSAWTPCNNIDDSWDESHLKATCLYLNSTLGVLSLMGVRSLKFLTYPWFSLEVLRGMPLPDWRTSALANVIPWLAAEFDAFSECELNPLIDIRNCVTRRAIDGVVARHLNVAPERVEQIRRTLSEEPSITA